MTGPLKNERHEKFAQGLAKALPQSQAYIAAGYNPSDGAASRLSKNVKVRARVTELQARVAEKLTTTVADIANQLDEDREFARTLGQSAAAVSATLGKAKVLGLIKEKHEHSGKNGGPIEYRDLGEDEIDARLDALSKEHGHNRLAH